jgi:hypothetical protein
MVIRSGEKRSDGDGGGTIARMNEVRRGIVQSRIRRSNTRRHGFAGEVG